MLWMAGQCQACPSSSRSLHPNDMNKYPWKAASTMQAERRSICIARYVLVSPPIYYQPEMMHFCCSVQFCQIRSNFSDFCSCWPCQYRPRKDQRSAVPQLEGRQIHWTHGGKLETPRLVALVRNDFHKIVFRLHCFATASESSRHV